MLLIHADYMKYKPVSKALKSAKDVEKREVGVNNVLVVFSCVEKDDERDVDEIARKAVEAIMEKVKEIRVENVLIYPYAHLSSNLASPSKASLILKKVFELLKHTGLNVSMSPFGWYKEFELKAKGHPLAEAFKEVTP